MKLVLQRVKRGSVTIYDDDHPRGYIKGEIAHGMVVFAGFRPGDNVEIASKLAKKLVELRIFEDSDGKMNQSVTEAGGEILVVSQFTLYGDTRKGRRPSFTGSMPPGDANTLYEKFVSMLESSGIKIATGVFGAKMEVEIINDGPVTFILEDDSAES